ncbi:MAG: aldose epimerase family protein [Eubacteriales bacterium]|nr:aldose epimerase family protein [Eubacteriales bacterium]
MKIEHFGVIKNGREVNLYTLENSNGMQVKVMNMGAALVSVLVPDDAGELCDVVLGYDQVSEYEKDKNCFGAVIGRNANRIKGTHIVIDRFEYNLDDNDNGNNLHSGFKGFNHEIWSAMYTKSDKQTISFCYESREGTQGFPGTVNVSVTYSLTQNNSLNIRYEAETNRKTIVNITNHAYFNLNGHDSGTVNKHNLYIPARYYTPVEPKGMCPTGEIASVDGTPMDFRKMKTIGQDIDSDFEQLKYAGGYDHNYVNDNNGQFKLAATAQGEKSGITMEVYTDRPGLQLYTGNYIGSVNGKDGAIYGSRHGFCLETQGFPDAIHHLGFPSPLIGPKEKFISTTEYVFGIRK